MIVGRQTALFLDYDGTLVDLAATPEAAHPPQPALDAAERAASPALTRVEGRGERLCFVLGLGLGLGLAPVMV